MVSTALGQNEYIAAFYIVWTMDLGAGVDRYRVLPTTRRLESRITHTLFWKHFYYQAEMMQYIQMKGYAGNPRTRIDNIDINE